MDLIVHIPEDIAARLAATGGRDDLSRRALEAYAPEEYRLGHLHNPDLRRLLGFENREEMNGFLRHHGIHESITVEEVQQQVEAMERLGF